MSAANGATGVEIQIHTATLNEKSGPIMPPGGRRPGAGRPVGSKNRLTPERKAFLRAFIDGTQEQAIEDWKQIDSAADRFRLWLTAAEYVYPKLGRQELVGDGGGAIQVQIVKYADKPEGT